MNTRTLAWLASALGVLILLALVGERQRTPPTAEVDTAFLPGLLDALDAVDSVAIVAAGNTPVATLDRGPDGWTVREREAYRADLTKVRHALLGLAEARVIEAKTANPELYAMLGVEDVDAADAAGLAVTLAGPATPFSVIIGTTAGDYRRYARRAGEQQSYLINRDPEVGEAAADWLDTAVLDLSSARVRAVTVTHPDGEVVRISKTSSEQANFTVEAIPEGRSLLYDSVANVTASVLQKLTLEDVERASGGEAEITTAIETFDGLVLTVVGIERDDGSWISISATADPTRTAQVDDAGADPAAQAEDAADTAAEARELNARLRGWRFKIAAYKFGQLTRRMDDLLQART